MLVHTGQHFDAKMSDAFFTQLDIPRPDYQLGIHGGSHADMTGRMLMALEPVMIEARPDFVMVYGDTNSTLAGSLTAAKLRIPLIHVEAGLRSFNRAMPEEINRVVSDHLSRVLLCPTERAVENLAAEGITRGVHHVGDVMYDATLYAAGKAQHYESVLARFGLTPHTYAVATVHREENTSDPQVLRKLIDYLSSRPHEVIFPTHPRTRMALARFGLDTGAIRLCEPLSYLEMTQLVKSAETIYTDSGGLQKEAYFHRVPCVTLRNETEWAETVTHGWNRLWHHENYAMPRRDITDYGTGDAAERIAAIVVELHGSTTNGRILNTTAAHRQDG